MDLVCDKCGWAVTRGQFIEVDLTPELLSFVKPEWVAGMLEADHFVETGCRGSIVPGEVVARDGDHVLLRMPLPAR